MSFDTNPANEYATGADDTVRLERIIEVCDTFNDAHCVHSVDYALHSGGDFTITLYSKFPMGWLAIGDAYNTLDIDEFYRQAEEPAQIERIAA